MSTVPQKQLLPGDVMLHTKTGNRYVYEGHCKVKFEGEWIDAISYTCELSGERFVTSAVRLENSFTVIEFK